MPTATLNARAVAYRYGSECSGFGYQDAWDPANLRQSIFLNHDLSTESYRAYLQFDAPASAVESSSIVSAKLTLTGDNQAVVGDNWAAVLRGSTEWYDAKGNPAAAVDYAEANAGGASAVTASFSGVAGDPVEIDVTQQVIDTFSDPNRVAGERWGLWQTTEFVTQADPYFYTPAHPTYPGVATLEIEYVDQGPSIQSRRGLRARIFR